MRKALIELLAERPIVHPTHVEAMAWDGGELRITVRGHAWWAAPYGPPKEGVIRFIFSHLSEGSLDVADLNFHDDEALEDFSVVSVEPENWAGPMEWSIFCSGPIPAPLDLYIRLQDFLAAEEAFRGPADFLNRASTLSAFKDMAGSAGFLLARGPASVRDVLCAELARQGVPHNVVHTQPDTAGDILVRLGGSAFLCHVVEAEF